jgi:aryl-alcohol dehydrogenase-like predicted oxidoreductase
MFDPTTNRREFLQKSLAAAAAVSLAPAARAADAAAKPELRKASDVIELGPSKIRVSRMLVGTGTYGAGHSSNQLRKLGAEGVADMLLEAYDKGVFTWDTSDGYGTHAAIKLALKKVPREKVTIVTKTPDYSGANLKPDLDRFLKEMDTDYIDVVLLHSRVRADWDRMDKNMMDLLSEYQQKKIVRSVGISVHSIDAMRTCAKSPWLEIAMVRLNPRGTRMDATPDRVLPAVEELRAAGKGIIAIKVLGEGQLRNRIDECLLFALNESPAHCFSIGCESKAELKDNIDRIERLSQKA